MSTFTGERGEKRHVRMMLHYRDDGPAQVSVWDMAGEAPEPHDLRLLRRWIFSPRRGLTECQARTLRAVFRCRGEIPQAAVLLGIAEASVRSCIQAAISRLRRSVILTGLPPDFRYFFPSGAPLEAQARAFQACFEQLTEDEQNELREGYDRMVSLVNYAVQSGGLRGGTYVPETGRSRSDALYDADNWRVSSFALSLRRRLTGSSCRRDEISFRTARQRRARRR